jgi:hypothetical protein
MKAVLVILFALFAITCIAQTPDTSQNNPDPKVYNFQTLWKAIRIKAIDEGARLTVSDKSDIRGGTFELVDTTKGFHPDGGIIISVPETKWAIARDISQSPGVVVDWYIADTASATNNSTSMQAAINAAIRTKKRRVIFAGRTYTGNFKITAAPLTIDGNGANILPAYDSAIMYVDKGAQQLVVNDLIFPFTNTSKSWHHADAIYVDGTNGTEDYNTFNHITIRGGTGYGMYLIGAKQGGKTVQRTHVNNSTIVQCGYANVRLEGVVLETQFYGCFFNQGLALGANPIRTNQQTGHPASPAREFRRGAVEILRWYDSTDLANNSLVPNRVDFIGCNFVMDDDIIDSLGAD